MLDFTGKRVLVVGGSSGLGKATARIFADAGARVIAASRGGDKLAEAAAEVGAEPATLDTRDNPLIEAFFARHDPFDHVVVTASQTNDGTVGGLQLEDAYASMDSKFWGAYRIARAARIVENGSLTLVSGYLAHRPSPTSVLQGAINAALEGLARGLALEKAPIRVNVVSPGTVDTPRHARLPPAEREAMYARVAARLPVRHIGEADDIATAILFLAGNPFVTGSVVTVDGGASIVP